MLREILRSTIGSQIGSWEGGLKTVNTDVQTEIAHILILIDIIWPLQKNSEKSQPNSCIISPFKCYNLFCRDNILLEMHVGALLFVFCCNSL